MKGYKVVDVSTRRYFSAMENSAKVEYFIGKETKPIWGCGPLAVFSKLEDARAYMRLLSPNPRFVLFSCEYTPSKRQRFYRKSNMSASPPLNLLSPPHGTEFADVVVLVFLVV
jgi:hypothetical protein